MDDAMDKLEEILESVEEFLSTSLTAPSPDDVKDRLNQLWADITRYGPTMPQLPDVRIPGLGDFDVPPLPPPQPPRTRYEDTLEWIDNHPWKATGVALGVVGAGLLVGYGERRQVVVVLGGDTPLGLPMILDLEKKGYIVIASVATPEAVEPLERRCHGYVRVLVLDPTEPDTVPVFLRSLSSTLSRRFPIASAGDPYASPASHPYIHSVVSLLSLPSPTVHAPLEHISLRDHYLPYLNATQITPLQVIQSLLPLLRNMTSNGKKTIVVCLPATEARVGLPFAAVSSMSAAGTLRAVEVLRREISIAALTGKSESMKNIKVVIVDVGAFNVGPQSNYLPPQDVYKATEKWTASEKITYGPAFAAISHSAAVPRPGWTSVFRGGDSQYGVPRKPVDVKVFVDSIVGVISNGTYGPSLFGFGLGLGRIRNWLRGERFSVGAGAYTYKVASHLPSLVLDTLLNLPAFLISIRNALLPTQPFVMPRRLGSDVHFPHPPASPAGPPSTTARSKPESEHDESSNNELSETGSEADVESNEGDGTGVESSWVPLPRIIPRAQSSSLRYGAAVGILCRLSYPIPLPAASSQTFSSNSEPRSQLPRHGPLAGKRSWIEEAMIQTENNREQGSLVTALQNFFFRNQGAVPGTKCNLAGASRPVLIGLAWAFAS
ncbi:hypothetical protein D9758_000779 [Tetrapyrgos nigripes]|uniref:DUF1776-domain-containing protein n=1 Tax=Tetrapyrgos nigripes TaxID=182062 RepID=A0A8H5LXH2_9AGAR|nr:hypothetical protein D9758_000779 [Tetrapyrgos nigripes]